MQGVTSLVVMPHKTTDSRCPVGPATSTEITTGDKSPASLCNPTEAKTTEGKLIVF